MHIKTDGKLHISHGCYVSGRRGCDDQRVHRDNVGPMVLQKAAPFRGTTVDMVDVH
jgi:hypothetical protein